MSPAAWNVILAILLITSPISLIAAVMIYRCWGTKLRL